MPFSPLQNISHVLSDGCFEFAGLGVQRGQLFVQGLKLLLEVLVADFLAGSDADVAARIQAPALRLDF